MIRYQKNLSYDFMSTHSLVAPCIKLNHTQFKKNKLNYKPCLLLPFKIRFPANVLKAVLFTVVYIFVLALFN